MKMETRAQFLANDFLKQPVNKICPMVLEDLSDKSAEVSMMVLSDFCVTDGDGKQMAQGGIVAVLVDFAGVYLARMQTDSKLITPLSELQETYLQPVLLGKDVRLFAEATLAAVVGSRIIVDVRVENQDKELKGMARLTFINRSI